MTTVKRMERAWAAGLYGRLLEELMVGRPEAGLPQEYTWRVLPATAAMVLIRLDELAQNHVPLFQRLVRVLLQNQETDGGWGDLMTTALALRALMLDGGEGNAVDRGLDYLVNLQKENGAWPAEPLRRFPEDVTTTAFVMYQLAGLPLFRQRVRFERALVFLNNPDRQLDAATRQLCQRSIARSQLLAIEPAEDRFIWS
ncbi:MAG: terpene cyclase/mutase family protein [Phycisphaerales bacterium]|nr:terpene cyclase/mutase family protein [Phycisphaerales bacterium]